jgi:hypothetical protein
VCKEYGIPIMADRFIPEYTLVQKNSDIIEFRTRKRQSKMCSKEIFILHYKTKKLLLTLLLTAVAITTKINAILKASHVDLRCKILCTVTQHMWSVMSYNSNVYCGWGLVVTN